MPQEQKEEEFELIPVSPLRKLERRIDELENMPQFDPKEFYREIIDIVRMNQQLVDELAKANDALRIEISKLPSKIEQLVANLGELISFIRASTVEEMSPASQETTSNLIGKFDQLIETNKKIIEGNQSMLAVLDSIERKLKRPTPPMSLGKPTLLQQKPML